ncbi:DNA cytosine methyltransferase [Mycoplasma crocodyli]|uniref:DNA cytosine methyltransferase n=1 Tax=Mycoplasma crocodyli TaxID=50052 RepID=UPI0034DE35CA
MKPEIFIIENVKNLLNTCNGYFLNEIIERMEHHGYNISYGILNGKDFWSSIK